MEKIKEQEKRNEVNSEMGRQDPELRERPTFSQIEKDLYCWKKREDKNRYRSGQLLSWG